MTRARAKMAVVLAGLAAGSGVWLLVTGSDEPARAPICRSRVAAAADEPAGADAPPIGGSLAAIVSNRFTDPRPERDGAEGFAIEGRVVDDDTENGVAGAVIFVGTEGEELTGARPATMRVDGRDFAGFEVVSDEQGRFRAVLGARQAARVRLQASDRLSSRVRNDVQVTPPAHDIVFRVEVRPAATILVRARDPAGQPIRTFSFTCQSPKAIGRHPVQDYVGTVTVVGDPKSPGLIPVTIRLDDRSVAEPPTRTLDVVPGTTAEVDLRIGPPGPLVTGRVVDEHGRGVAQAHVWWGSWEGARNEGIGPLDPKRIHYAVKTNEAGAFGIEGREAMISAWHPGYSAATVPYSDPVTIVLPATGALVLKGGRPGTRASLIDESIAFGVDGVARKDGLSSGAHAVMLDAVVYIAEVRPKEETTIDVAADTWVTALLAPEALTEGVTPRDVRAFLRLTSRVATLSMPPLAPNTGDDQRRVRGPPGDGWLDTALGQLIPATLLPSGVLVCRPGPVTATFRGRSGQRVRLFPAACEIRSTALLDVFGFLRVGDDGTGFIAGLAPGRYALFIGHERLPEIELRSSATIDLD